MRKVPNDIVTTLLRSLPVLIENIDASKGSLRLRNAVRMTKKCINKLNKIEKNERVNNN